MYKSQIKDINRSLSKTQKAIIALGCSFVQGQGAVDDALYENYTWKFKKEGTPLQIEISKKDKENIIRFYPLVNSHDGELDFTFMEYKNSFVNVLCNKYLDKEYTPINLGLRGCGNRATIKELYLNNEIKWNRAVEKIVIYCPSGLERFDFVNDTYTDHFRWVCMWPHYEGVSDTPIKQLLWEGYAKNIWSEKNQIIEQICHVQELITWCNLNNAKLIITPAFDKRYDKEYFEFILSQYVERNNEKVTISKHKFKKHPDVDLVNLFPWENLFYPNNCKTFVELALSNESNIENKLDHYFQFLVN